MRIRDHETPGHIRHRIKKYKKIASIFSKASLVVGAIIAMIVWIGLGSDTFHHRNTGIVLMVFCVLGIITVWIKGEYEIRARALNVYLHEMMHSATSKSVYDEMVREDTKEPH